MFRKFLKLLIILAISILIGNMAYGMYQEFELSNGPSAGAELNDIYLNFRNGSKWAGRQFN